MPTNDDYNNYIKADSPCPCTLIDEPCDPRCTCLNPISSRGCDYCASYGSDEQRKAKAEWIAKKLKE